MKRFTSKTCTRLLACVILMGILTTGCVKDLDRKPFYEVNTETVYRDPANYIKILAKLYASFNLAGQNTTGAADVSDIGDEGEASYLRAYWSLQQMCTDETAIAWNSPYLQDLNKINWNSGNTMVRLSYNRIFYSISLCNEFIRETADDKLSSRGITDANAVMARQYRAEARFLRALAYSHALDLFGNVPFVTDKDAPGKFLPRQVSRVELFTYLESELQAIEGSLAAPRTPGYGHADQAAAWTLLAKLYLNAQVYTGTPKYSECRSYTEKILQAGYSLAPEYRLLFLADNDKMASQEIIFPITSDGLREQTYGGTTFLVHSSVGGRMTGGPYGISNAWQGNRARKNLPQLFTSTNGSTDKRGNFFTYGAVLDNTDLTVFTDGYGVTKWKNVTSTGVAGSDPTGTFVDTDFPMFRLADVYLMYAEAMLRGGGGDRGQALSLVNQLRTRSQAPQIADTDLDLPFILAERSRELYWETYRRTDLIRFDKFTEGAYVWPWKGGVIGGQGVAGNFKLYPLPASDIVANPGLKQNPGY